MSIGSVLCPLCGASSLSPYAEVRQRRYRICQVCDLVSMSPADRLDAVAERACYEHHRNDPSDVRYRAFLDRLAVPLIAGLQPGDCGLDFGSGPGPTLSKMLTERGFPTVDYDPFFAPDASLLERTYNFVVCTETAEHFFQPGLEFERLDTLLRPGAVLAVMTSLRPPHTPFAKWAYVQDPTHVSLYSWETMLWIAHWRGFSVTFPERNVVIFRKGDADLRL